MPDGVKGWEAATEELPDLVISDVMMPGMDGFTLCGKLKMDARTSHIPTVLLTAKSSTADQISGLEMGADIYLAKPFSILVLKLHLRNLLAARERLRRRYVSQIAAPSGEEAQTIDDQFMKKALDFIVEKMDDPEFGVAALSTHMLMSQPILYKKIKALTDMSVNDFIKSIRLKRAAQLLLEQRHTVYEVIYMVGYSDRKHFAKEFKKMFEVNPSEYGKARGKAQ
jgi:YesN/AraC family two-component response regulator